METGIKELCLLRSGGPILTSSTLSRSLALLSPSFDSLTNKQALVIHLDTLERYTHPNPHSAFLIPTSPPSPHPPSPPSDRTSLFPRLARSLALLILGSKR